MTSAASLRGMPIRSIPCDHRAGPGRRSAGRSPPAARRPRRTSSSHRMSAAARPQMTRKPPGPGRGEVDAVGHLRAGVKFEGPAPSDLAARHAHRPLASWRAPRPTACGDPAAEPQPSAPLVRVSSDSGRAHRSRWRLSPISSSAGSSSHADRLRARRRQAVAASGCAAAEQADRGEHVVTVHDHPAVLGQLPAALASRRPVRRGSGRSTPGRPWRRTPPEPTQQVDLAQVLAGALDDPPARPGLDRRTTRDRPACRRRARSPRPRGDRLVLASLGVGRRQEATGRRCGVRRRRGGRRRRSPASCAGLPRGDRAPAHAEVALDRAGDRGGGHDLAGEPGVLVGSSSTTRVHVGGRPADVDDHHVAGTGRPSTPRASTSTPVSTRSGVAPRTIAVKSARPLSCLPPITWARNISRIARAGRVGREHADPRHHVVGQDVRQLRPAIAATSSRAVDVAGHHHRARPAAAPTRRARRRAAPPRCRRRCRRSAAPRPARVVRASSTVGRLVGRPRPSTATTLPPLESATRRPASAVTSSSLPTTAIRSPPPALRSTPAPRASDGAGCPARPARPRHASNPSSTSVSIVVAVLAAAASMRAGVDGRPAPPW